LKILGKDKSKVTCKKTELFIARVKMLNSSKAKGLGFKLTIPIKESMQKILKWFKRLYSSEEL